MGAHFIWNKEYFSKKFETFPSEPTRKKLTNQIHFSPPQGEPTKQ